MTRHVLTEYTSQELVLDSAVVDELVARHRRHVRLEPIGRHRWRVTPNSHVGTIVVGEHRFLIKPKAGLQNMLAMLDIEVASETWRNELALLDDDPDLLAVMARLFCIACEDTTRRGVRRSYVPLADRLVAPRGRIDVGTIARRPGLPTPVPCRFDEHTADIPINQILRTALERVRRIPTVPSRWKRRLNAQLVELDDAVTPLHDLDWVNRWDPAPMDLHYETSVRLAHLILTNTSLRDRFGDTAAKSLLLDMNDLFEKWVLRRIEAALPTFTVTGQYPTSLGADGTIDIRPDIAVLLDGRCVAAADTKYKLLADDGSGRASDYYQALAYATALRLPGALLIYARWPDDEAGRAVPIRNSNVTITTVGIDLTQPIDAAAEQVTAAAHNLAIRTGSAAY